MKSITIDRSKRLKDDPGKGHNRWHPDVPPVLEVDPVSGDLYVADTQNATIRRVTSGGSVTTLAGTAGSRASISGNSTASLSVGMTTEMERVESVTDGA